MQRGTSPCVASRDLESLPFPRSFLLSGSFHLSPPTPTALFFAHFLDRGAKLLNPMQVDNNQASQSRVHKHAQRCIRACSGAAHTSRSSEHGGVETLTPGLRRAAARAAFGPTCGSDSRCARTLRAETCPEVPYRSPTSLGCWVPPILPVIRMYRLRKGGYR